MKVLHIENSYAMPCQLHCRYSVRSMQIEFQDFDRVTTCGCSQHLRLYESHPKRSNKLPCDRKETHAHHNKLCLDGYMHNFSGMNSKHSRHVGGCTPMREHFALKSTTSQSIWY